MTTRDACDTSWMAVLRGQVLGILATLLLALSMTGCATTGQDSGVGNTASQSDQAVPQDASSPPTKSPSSYVVKGKRYFVKKDAAGFVEKGTASWYGKRFHGRSTSSGEQYDMHAMTAAHKNLPIASLIQVTNLDNGLSTVVRVNDRGPFHGNRVLDLSYAAASQLDMVARGSAKVAIQVIDSSKPKLEAGLQDMFVAASDKARADSHFSNVKPIATETQVAANTETDILGTALASDKPRAKTYDTSALYVQVGSFESRSNAEALRRDLVAKLENGVAIKTDVYNDITPYKVEIGPVNSKDEAKDLSRKLASLGVGNSMVVSR
jgi:rare lipoprotein A